MTAPVGYQAVLESLGTAIATERLAAGQAMRVDQVQDQYDVSRTVAREALRILESLGMVSLKRRVGCTIQPRSAWAAFDPRVMAWRLSGPRRLEELDQLVQLRAAVEPIAARLACANPEAAATLADLADRMRELAAQKRGATPEFLAADIAFHRTLLVAGGNDYFAALSDLASTVLSERERMGLQFSRPDPKVLHLHAAIAAAVGAEEPDAAERATRALMAHLAAEVLQGSAAQVHREPTIAGGGREPLVNQVSTAGHRIGRPASPSSGGREARSSR